MALFDRRTATVTLYGGDYLDRIRFLEQKAEAAREAEGDSPALGLDEESEALALAREHDALVAEAEAQAVQVVLGALPRKTWRDLVDAHPPREGHRGDAAVGVNEESFADALVPLSVVSPVLEPGDIDDLSAADFERLYLTAFALNRAPVADPKASLASRMTQRNDAI